MSSLVLLRGSGNRLGLEFYWNPTSLRRAPLTVLFVLLVGMFSQGCSTARYYGQAIRGHAEIHWRSRSIGSLLRDPALDPTLRQKLELTQTARAFAATQLALPIHGSYTSYADLGRDYVVWNVIATPELSLQPVESCFPLIGCLPYRGFFKEASAAAAARELAAAGHDVHVGGVAAYSTLGWFRDPVLNTMTRWDDGQLIQVIFHELAHQRLYCPDDGDFNEAFATAVARLGYRVWIEQRLSPELQRQALVAERRDDDFVGLLLTTRARLLDIFTSERSEPDKRAAKSSAFSDLEAAYSNWRIRWHGYAGYDAWFEQGLNNARIAAIATYHDLVPAFLQLFEMSGRHFDRFYRNVEWLARQKSATRATCLETLLAGNQSTWDPSSSIDAAWCARSPRL